MPVVGPRLALDALHSFLTTSSGTTLSLNDELALYRTQESLDTTQVPDVVTFTKGVTLGSQTTSKSPVVSTAWIGSSGETTNNSRILQNRFWLDLLLIDKDVAGDEATLMLRILDYVSVMLTMFMRGSVAGAKGYTLNNGTGNSVSRINRASIDDVIYGEDGDLNDANTVIRFSITIETIEDYPG